MDSSFALFRGGVPPPDLTYRISKIRLADATYLIITQNRPQNSSLLTLYLNISALYTPMLINSELINKTSENVKLLKK